MARSEEEKLVFSVEARIADVEKNMARAAKTTDRKFKEMKSSAKINGAAIEATFVGAVSKVNGALGKIGLGGLAAGGIAGIVAGIGSIAKGVAELGDQAKIAGINVKDFQRLKFVSEQNRVGVDALTDGLKELNMRADEFIVTGGGAAAEAFQRLGYTATELKEKLKDPSNLFSEIIGKLGKLDKASQLRVSDEVFGGSGGQAFVKFIEKGETGIRAQIKAANDLGLVMDEQMIKKAEEVDRLFNVIATTVGTTLKKAVVDAVSAWMEFVDSYKEFKDQQNPTLSNRQADLGTKRIDLENERMKIKGGDGGFPYWNKDGPLAKGRIHEIELELAKIAAEERQIVDELNRRVKDTSTQLPGLTVSPSNSDPIKNPGDLKSYLIPGRSADHVAGMESTFEAKLLKMLQSLPDNLRGQVQIKSGYRSVERQAELWQGALQKYGSVAEARKWVAPPGNSQHNKGNAADLAWGSPEATKWAHQNASQFGLSFPLGNEDWHVEDADARKGAMSEKTADLEARGQSYDDIIAKAKEFVEAEGIEVQALDMTAKAAATLRYEQQLLNEAKSAGLTLNPAQVDSLKALAAGMAEAEAKTKSLAESQKDAQEAAANFAANAGGVAKGFIQDLAHGVKAADALKNALGRVAEQMLDGALNTLFGGGSVKGGGAFGALLGGLFKPIPGNAKGTDSWTGGPTWVGEEGPEIINAPKGAQIIPNHAIRKPSASGVARSAPAAAARNEPSNLNVNITGASGDAHIRELTRQGVAQALADKAEADRRGGFGSMQQRYASQKG